MENALISHGKFAIEVFNYNYNYNFLNKDPKKVKYNPILTN
jgi:hypothetical protein